MTSRFPRRPSFVSVALLSFSVALLACGESGGDDLFGEAAPASGASSGGSTSKGGAAGAAGAVSQGGTSQGASGKGGSLPQGGSPGAGGKAGKGGSGQAGQSAMGGATGKGGGTGTAGMTGQGGSTGTAGTTGQAGTTGTAGMTGQAGMTGTAGSTGTAGNTGTAGSTGTAGTTGQGGSTGTAGTTGQGGDTGTAGTTGQGGDTGTAGTTGQGGSTGTAGTTGQGGDTGTAGTTGQGGSTATDNIDNCPGEALALTEGTITINGDTSALSNNTNSGDGQCGGSNSKDAIYRLKADVAGNFRIDAQADFNVVLASRTVCEDPGSLLTCRYDGQAATLFGSLAPGQELFVIVDGRGFGEESGAYELTIEFTPSVCGNGSLEAGEICDDGNTDPGDGCAADCTVEPSCVVQAKSVNDYNNPQQAPDGCLTVLFVGEVITDGGDDDYFCFNAPAGAGIVAGTFIGSPNICPQNAGDTAFELFAGLPPGPVPQWARNNCSQGNIGCDNNDGVNQCAYLSVDAPSDGQYCLRVYAPVGEWSVSDYGVLVRVFP